MNDKLERLVIFKPAFDKRSDDPRKDYGIGAVQCYMVLKGEKGAVHFTFSTGMYLPETVKEYYHDKRDLFHFTFSGSEGEQAYYMGYDVGYHSPTPQFESQQISGDDCPYLGKPCYCDGSALRSDEWMDVLVRKGSDAIWSMLEEDYKERFEHEEVKSA